MPDDFPKPRTGDSIAINGVCLTVKEHSSDTLVFDVIPETLARSNLSTLELGESVNVEPSLRLGDVIGGHLVYGHVDAVSEIAARDPEGQGFRLWCTTPPALRAFIVEKGYVSLDGVSLTVAQVEPERFAVALIPETLKRTTLGRKGVGRSVNVEADPVARYVAAQLQDRTGAERRTTS
jgi:riboflavin synthase